MNTTPDFTAIGRSAYLNGAPRAPMFNAEVHAAVECLPVGGGAAEIMKAFTKGWDAENMAADWDV